MYPNTVPMRLGPHADELASQDTSFVQFEAQKKALEISAALRDLRQVDMRSLGCRWKHAREFLQSKTPGDAGDGAVFYVQHST